MFVVVIPYIPMSDQDRIFFFKYQYSIKQPSDAKKKKI